MNIHINVAIRMFFEDEIRGVCLAYDVSNGVKHVPFAFSPNLVTFVQSHLEHVARPFLPSSIQFYSGFM